MNSSTRRPASEVLGQYEVLASTRTRHLVTLLADQPKPVSPAALAVVRAVEEHDGAPADVSESAIQRHQIELAHKHIPRLADDGLVEHDGDGVAVTDEGVTTVRTLEAAIPDGIADEDLLDAMRHDRRRATVTVLAKTPHEQVTVTGLAVAVATAERNAELTDIDQEHLTQVRTTLHHVHLPKLAECGFIDYDPETLTVTDTGTETLGSAWLDETCSVEPLTSDSGQTVPTTEEDVWTLEERESVVERMRALADHADDELFVVLPTEGLLLPGCLTHLRMATERGVDVTVGSPSEAVHDQIRDAVPEATVWQTDRDWLGPAPGENRQLSRLVVADRRAAMLAMFDGSENDETAITGDGRDNGLVTTVRELLGSRLETTGGRPSGHQSPAPP